MVFLRWFVDSQDRSTYHPPPMLLKPGPKLLLSSVNFTAHPVLLSTDNGKLHFKEAFKCHTPVVSQSVETVVLHKHSQGTTKICASPYPSCKTPEAGIEQSRMNDVNYDFSGVQQSY